MSISETANKNSTINHLQKLLSADVFPKSCQIVKSPIAHFRFDCGRKLLDCAICAAETKDFFWISGAKRNTYLTFLVVHFGSRSVDGYATFSELNKPNRTKSVEEREECRVKKDEEVPAAS